MLGRLTRLIGISISNILVKASPSKSRDFTPIILILVSVFWVRAVGAPFSVACSGARAGHDARARLFARRRAANRDSKSSFIRFLYTFH